MTRSITWFAIAAALALGACNKKSENPPSAGVMSSGSGSAAPAVGSGSAAPATGSGSAAPATGSGSAAATGSATATTAAAVDVPTEVDFEDAAAAKITDKNVEAQVQALEKELDQK